MPIFTYTAKSRPNKTIQGEIDADSQQDAINRLTRMGYFPISVEAQELSFGKKGILPLRKVSHREIVLFTRQLSSLLESGVNLLNGLNIIADQTPNHYFKAVLSDISSKIRDGKPLSESLSLHQDLFPNVYTSMIHSGEAGGNLEKTLKELADFLEKEEEFKNSVRAALSYPVFVSIVGALTVVSLLVFVIPRLISMFEDMGQALPLPTRILISLSGFLRSYWWFILALTIIAVFLLRRLSKNPRQKVLLDALKLKTAVFGTIILKTEVSRLMRTLSLLLSSGIPIIYSLDVSISVLENSVLKSELQGFKEQIKSGSSLSRCLKESKIFPGFVTNIVAVGEETGSLDKSLMNIAQDYERDVDRSLKALSRLLEPVIILVMGLVVGFIVVSMLLPIFQINLIAR